MKLAPPRNRPHGLYRVHRSGSREMWVTLRGQRLASIYRFPTVRLLMTVRPVLDKKKAARKRRRLMLQLH